MKTVYLHCRTPLRQNHSVLDGRWGHQQGATLIEVLVAVLLLSFGIVGLAGLQMNGAKFNHGSYLRSQGTALAYDMADRIRANVDACLGNGCSYITPLATAFDGTAAQACGRVLALQATPQAMAAVDVNQWKDCIERTLPQGQGVVQVAGAGAVLGNYQDQCRVVHQGSSTVIIEVTWAETRQPPGQPNAPQRDCVVVRTDVRP